MTTLRPPPLSPSLSDSNIHSTHEVNASESDASASSAQLLTRTARKKSKSYLKKISNIIIRPFHAHKLKSIQPSPTKVLSPSLPLSPTEQSGAMDAAEFAKAVGITIRNSFDGDTSDNEDTLQPSSVYSKCSCASPPYALPRGRSVSMGHCDKTAILLYGKLDNSSTVSSGCTSLAESSVKGARRDSCFSHKSQTSDTVQATATSLSQLSMHSTISRGRRNSILDIDWSRASPPHFIPSGASSSPLSSPLKSHVNGWDHSMAVQVPLSLTLCDDETPSISDKSVSGSDCSTKTAITEKRGRFTITAESPSAAITASRRRSSFSPSEIMALNAHAQALPTTHPTSYVNQRRSSSASLPSYDHYVSRQSSTNHSTAGPSHPPSISIHPSSPQAACFPQSSYPHVAFKE